MTEYDYSPEAIESYRRTQDRISNWTSASATHAHRFANPNKLTPSEAARLTEGPGFTSHRAHTRSKSTPPQQVQPHDRDRHRHRDGGSRDRQSSRSSSRKHSESGRSHRHHHQSSNGGATIIYQPAPQRNHPIRSTTMPVQVQYAAPSPLRYNTGFVSPPAAQVYYPQQYQQVQSPTYAMPSYGFPTVQSPKKTPLFKRLFSGVFSGSGNSGSGSSRKSKRERRRSY